MLNCLGFPFFACTASTLFSMFLKGVLLDTRGDRGSNTGAEALTGVRGAEGERGSKNLEEGALVGVFGSFSVLKSA